MEQTSALLALSALAHPTRLEVFRLLVSAEPRGLAAGDISAKLDVLQNTMSTNLAILARAELISSTREGRSIRYRAELDTMRALITYLTRDCCGGRPEVCGPLVELVACDR